MTSSPAPLRRDRKDKFDYDDTINSPHDIKKALFAKKSLMNIQFHRDQSELDGVSNHTSKKARSGLTSTAFEDNNNKENHYVIGNNHALEK